MENKICILIFSTVVFETCLILRIQRMSKRLHVKYPLFLSGFNETSNFSTDFRKKSTNIKFYQDPSSGKHFIPCGRT
jgi:hypothetical protein